MISKLLFLANIFGYRIEKIIKKKVIDTSLSKSPLAALLNESESVELVFNIPMEYIRSWGGRKLAPQINPFINIMLDIKKSDCPIAYKESVLYKYAEDRHCKSASDVLGVNVDYFSRLSPDLAVFPWDIVNPEDKKMNQISTLQKELKVYFPNSSNLDRVIDLEVRGEAEIRRIKTIFNSLSRNGYDSRARDFHHIEGQLLIANDKKWVVLIRQGEHRVAALFALGYTTVPILIKKQNIVRESDVEYWWQVTQNRINEKDALEIFRRIVTGDDTAPLVNIAGFFI